MAMRLSGSDRYNPEQLPVLEDYVKQQVKDITYDLDANLALLRLYYFDPDSVNFQILAPILVKGLMQLPHNDFNLYLHLIPERYQEESTIAPLISLHRHLESGRFARFWAEVDAARDTVNPVAGFYEAMRRYIIYALRSTFQKVSRATLAQSLKLEGTTLEKTLEAHKKEDGWIVDADDFIVFPRIDSGESKPQVVHTEIKFDHIAPVLAIGAH